MDTPQKLLALQVTNNWKWDVPVEVKYNPFKQQYYVVCVFLPP